MKIWIRTVCLSALSLALTLGGTSLEAQDTPPAPGGNGQGGGGRGGRGNFDPEQMRQRMLERYREQLEVKDDDEWKLISERIEKVSEARRDLGTAGGFGMGRPPGGRRGADAPGGAAGGDDNARRFRAFMGEAGPESEALQKAIDSNASADELKSKLTAYREARKKKEATLEKAQEGLKQVLTAKQEAVAVLNGLLK